MPTKLRLAAEKLLLGECVGGIEEALFVFGPSIEMIEGLTSCERTKLEVRGEFLNF